MKGLRQTNTASKLHSQQSLILSINRYSRLESLQNYSFSALPGKII